MSCAFHSAGTKGSECSLRREGASVGETGLSALVTYDTTYSWAEHHPARDLCHTFIFCLEMNQFDRKISFLDIGNKHKMEF